MALDGAPIAADASVEAVPDASVGRGGGGRRRSAYAERDLTEGSVPKKLPSYVVVHLAMTTDDSIRKYLGLRRQLDGATHRLDRMMAELVQAASLLRDWKRVAVSNSAITFPIDVAAQERLINAQTWPDAQRLAEDLADWHRLYSLTRTAWRRLPEEARAGLPLLPDYYGMVSRETTT